MMPVSGEQTPQSMVAQLVLECKGKGSFLPYVDYAIINAWVAAAPDFDTLLLILADVLPEYFEGEKSSRQLAGVNKLVLSCIKDRSMHQT